MNRCRICDQPGAGNHFGVHSCRACAAFFRRGALRKTPYKCKNVGGVVKNCEIYNRVLGVYNCKKCRMQRCRQLGMNVNKFQFGRDSITGSLEVTRFSESRKSKPSFLVFFENTQTKKTHVDLRYLLTQAESILLRKNPQNHSTATSTLLNLTKAFTSVQQLPSAQNFQICTKFGIHEKLQDWEKSFLMVAKWLSRFDKFRELPIDFRMKFLTGIWHLWVTFDKLSMNYLARKRGITDHKIFLTAENVYVDPSSLKKDFAWMANYNRGSYKFFSESIDWDMLTFIQPLLELNPSNVELTFMISQLCFNYAGKRFQGQILEVCENFQEILGNDIHDYYVNGEGLVRYSARLAKLMKFVRSIEENFRDKKWKVELGETFGVWRMEFSHPEMFEDSFC